MAENGLLYVHVCLDGVGKDRRCRGVHAQMCHVVLMILWHSCVSLRQEIHCQRRLTLMEQCRGGIGGPDGFLRFRSSRAEPDKGRVPPDMNGRWWQH